MTPIVKLGEAHFEVKDATRVEPMKRRPAMSVEELRRSRAAARAMADDFRTIAQHAAEPPAEGFNRRVVSVAIVDGNDTDGLFHSETILTPVQIKLIAVALATYSRLP